MEITRISQFSGVENTRELPITEEAWLLWDNGNGPLIQKCFPNLTSEEREFILTGITGEEWDMMFPDEEE
jgi:hypothetical protein